MCRKSPLLLLKVSRLLKWSVFGQYPEQCLPLVALALDPQARDCDVDCANLRPYCQRKHLCEKHIQVCLLTYSIGLESQTCHPANRTNLVTAVVHQLVTRGLGDTHVPGLPTPQYVPKQQHSARKNVSIFLQASARQESDEMLTCSSSGPGHVTQNPSS